MSRNIPADMREFVNAAIAGGRYESEDEILAEALRLWRQREEDLDRLRAKLQSGVDQLDREEGIDGEVVLRELREVLAIRSRIEE